MTLKGIIAKLDSLSDYKEKYRFLSSVFYELGVGCGRAVFQIDDNLVIKLSLNEKTRQNQDECKVYQKFNNLDILPKLYYKADDYSWIITEKVLDATSEDFVKLVGMPFYSKSEPSIIRFVDWCFGWTSGDFRKMPGEEEEYRKLVNSNKWFSELSTLVKSGLDDIHMENFGLAMRDSGPYIVILDSGAIDYYNFEHPLAEHKKSIRLTEGQLKRIVEESIRKILNCL